MKRTLLNVLLAVLLLAFVVSCAKAEHQHTFGEPEETEDSISYTCTKCGYKEVHKHTYQTSWEKDDDYHWHVATCEHKEKKGSYSEHEWKEVSRFEPTCTLEGGVIKNCTLCNKSKKEKIPSAGHKFGDKEYTNAEGKKCKRCEACGAYVEV